MDIQSIGVIGAGVMGEGLCQVLAQAGIRVYLLDINPQALEKVRNNFIKNLRLQMMLNQNLSNESPQDILERVTFTTDYTLLSNVDYVIENVTEKWDIKKEVFIKLDNICPKQCVFASNTSAIPIDTIASVTERKDKVIGLHFMNPVPLKQSVEMIRGPQTSQETIDVSKSLLSKMNKQWILVNDSPGFVSNRVLMLTINEAICLLEEQVASAEDIDRVFKTCFSYKMGPLETADLIGLDTILLSIEVLHDNFKSEKYEPCALLEKMVKDGHLGRKSGKGFYNY